MTARCGFVAVVGRPNVGKSTLINALAGEKKSIVSPRKQTTRGVIRAVCNFNSAQVILLDTPGWEKNRGDDFNRRLNGGGEWAVHNSDAILFLSAAQNFCDDDDQLLCRLPPQKTVAVINKTDLLRDKNLLLPAMAAMAERRPFAAIVPISATRKQGLDGLTAEIIARLPAGAPLFSSGDCFDGDFCGDDWNFLFGELLREKLCRCLGDELPYRAAVIAKSRREKILFVDAIIFVERESQKPVVIGRGGRRLKKMATAARKEMEELCGEKIFLSARVQVRAWRQDEKLLQKMRIGDGKG